MSWLLRYRVRHYLQNSIWIEPVLSIAAALIAVRCLHWIETSLAWQSNLAPSTVQAVLGALAASMFTFIVFVSSALLVAVQLASSQLTPRIIGIVFKDPITKVSLVAFVFTFTFTLAVLVRVTETVPPFTTQLAAYSGLASLVVFLYLIDHVGKALRPSGALWSVASLGRKVIESVYHERLSQSRRARMSPVHLGAEKPVRTITNMQDGVVLAFDIHGLVSLAEKADCVLEMAPQVGDFVAAGDPLFRVYRSGETLSTEAVRHSVAVGQERTLEQDPAFAFRIIVDIASKGLSPAINDPTTAVLAVDQIHHLLRNVGSRRLDDGWICDKAGQPRLIYRTPDWGDFVRLAVTEIRQFGGSSIQVTRRLRAMLENLIETLPEDHIGLLQQELKLVRRSAQRFFTEPEDLALADISDSQGVGGKPGRLPPDRQTEKVGSP